MSSYKVIIEGNTLSGFNPEQVRPRLAALVNKSEEIAARLLSGHPSTVKSGVDQATGTRYVNALMQIGVACRVERETLDIDIGEKNSSSDAAAPHGIGLTLLHPKRRPTLHRARTRHQTRNIALNAEP